MRAGPVPNPERPDGIFLFTGPVGVGKYEMASALAEYLYGSDMKITTFDLSEYTQEHYIAQLIGLPPVMWVMENAVCW